VHISKTVFLILLASASAVRAQTVMTGPDGVRQLRVHYADLNVTSKAGAEALHERVRAASRAVCRPVPDLRDLKESASFEACVAASMARAMADVQMVEHTASSEKPSVGATR
jgi:UrcA family protein